jgi:predicted nucleic acid-binding protein
VTALYLADTSAYTIALRSPSAADKLRQLAVEGLLATFVTVDLELGYAARNLREHEGVGRGRARLVQLSMVDEIALRAREVQAKMAARGQHRAAGIVDLLTASAAEYHGATILHYDTDFDHIAAVTGQPVDWIAPKGSVT